MIFKQMSVTVLYSINCFLILVLRVLNFSFIFLNYNCIFYEFTLFPCRVIRLLTSPIKERHCREISESFGFFYKFVFCGLVT